MIKELNDVINENGTILKYGLDKPIKEIADKAGLINLDAYDFVDLLKKHDIVAFANDTFIFNEPIAITVINKDKPTQGILYIEANQSFTEPVCERIVNYAIDRLGRGIDLIYGVNINKSLDDNHIRIFLLATK